MISAVAWVPKGAAAKEPIKYEMTPEEEQAIRDAAEQEGQPSNNNNNNNAGLPQTLITQGANNNNSNNDNNSTGNDELPADLNMDDYDDDDNMGMMGDDTVYQAEDNYITLPNEVEEDDEEEDDKQIKDTDAILLATRTEDDFSSLEVYVYDEETGNLYVHHDITLSAFPLCLAWVGGNPSDVTTTTQGTKQLGNGNFCAIGTFKPEIEIWNLDVIEALGPVVTLGGRDTNAGQNSPSRRSRLSQPFKAGSHMDAIMCLSWNTQQRHVLASGSADKTVKLWDTTTSSCLMTMKHHSDKVQAAVWHPLEQTVLATGAFDKNIAVLDVRQIELGSKCTVTSDIESIQWNPHNPAQFAASCENGAVYLYDARNITSPIFTLQAHESACSSVTFSSMVPGFMGTVSIDKTVKLWDIQDGRPTCVTSKSMGVGDLLCGQFFMNDPYVLAVGGSKGQIALWDTSEQTSIERKFSSRIKAAPTPTLNANLPFLPTQQTANSNSDNTTTNNNSMMMTTTDGASNTTSTSSSSGKKKKKKKKKKSKN